MNNVNLILKVNETVATLYPYARYLTRNNEDAEELVQETQYKAIINMDKFREDTNLRGWLRVIMKNIFINNYRSSQRRSASRELFKVVQWWDTEDGNSGESALQLKDLEKVINGIDKDQRQAFMLHFNGYKYGEIATMLQLPLGTVKSRIFLARKYIMRKMKVERDRLEYVLN